MKKKSQSHHKTVQLALFLLREYYFLYYDVYYIEVASVTNCSVLVHMVLQAVRLLPSYVLVLSGLDSERMEGATTLFGGIGSAALICFLESKDYVDCLKLAIALGGDADTLAAIAGPMAYAYYREMPEELIENAKATLPEWMLWINEELDNYVNKK